MSVYAAGITEVEYFSPAYPDRAAVDAAFDSWDATTANWAAQCPTRGHYAIDLHLVPKEQVHFLVAGKALHAGMAVYYSHPDRQAAGPLALDVVRAEWGDTPALPPRHKYAHLTMGHVEVIFKNYLDYAKHRDANFKPLTFAVEDLNLRDVVAAVWRINGEGRVIFGESKIIMNFPFTHADGQIENFLYAGRPDLPIQQGGSVLIMDHKSTNSYLSDWYFSQYRFSNQLRGYAKMIQELTGAEINGALINGIYMGDKAASVEFKGTRFARYGPFMYLPGHLDEAIQNQYWWKKTHQWHRQQEFFPQHTGKMCSGCPYDALCAATPRIRSHVAKAEYRSGHTEFLDL